jgi:hypothetical protein
VSAGRPHQTAGGHVDPLPGRRSRTQRVERRGVRREVNPRGGAGSVWFAPVERSCSMVCERSAMAAADHSRAVAPSRSYERADRRLRSRFSQHIAPSGCGTAANGYGRKDRSEESSQRGAFRRSRRWRTRLDANDRQADEPRLLPPRSRAESQRSAPTRTTSSDRSARSSTTRRRPYNRVVQALDTSRRVAGLRRPGPPPRRDSVPP